MKKAITVIAAVVALAVPATASAEWAGQGNSTPGIDRYNDIAANPNPDAQCGTGGGSGAFGCPPGRAMPTNWPGVRISRGRRTPGG